MFLEISKKSEKHLCQNLFLKKLQAGDACTFFKKETLEEVFPVNNFPYRTPPVAASVH